MKVLQQNRYLFKLAYNGCSSINSAKIIRISSLALSSNANNLQLLS